MTQAVSKSKTKALYQDVRACLISKGTNLSKWCATKNLNYQSVRGALLDSGDGVKYKRLRTQITKELGLRK